MSYCIYLRKSRKDDEAELRGEGETLARHKNALLSFAGSKGLEIDRIYSEVVSGDSIAARPIMQELLDDVGNGLWEGVLVMEIERLARGNTGDQAIIAQTFKYSDTLIVTPLKTYDPNNEYDEEYFEFGLFMSRREYKTINRRMQQGRLASAKEGKFAAPTPPFGYERIKLMGEKGHSLKIVPEEAKVVRLIFDWYVNGIPQTDGSFQEAGIGKISKCLEQHKLFPPKSDAWSSSSIRAILRNPTYIGKIRWNYRKTKKKIVDGSIKKERTVNSPENYMLTDGLHEPIISIDMWDKAQVKLKEKSAPPIQMKNQMTNPLSGLIYCSYCGRSLVRHSFGGTAKNYPPVLKCPVHSCKNQATVLSIVEKRVLDSLKSRYEEYNLQWSTTGSSAQEEYKKSIELQEQTLSQIEKEIAATEKQRDVIYTSFEKGIYSSDEFIERSRKNTDTLVELNKKKKLSEEELNHIKITYENKVQWIPKVKYLLSVYNTLSDAEAKNSLLKQVIEKIEYTKSYTGKSKMKSEDFNILVYPKIPKTN